MGVLSRKLAKYAFSPIVNAFQKKTPWEIIPVYCCRHVLQRHPHQKPLLYLKDVRHRELELIIQFIYKGECQVQGMGICHPI